jgi:hypothetical protein
MAAIDAADAIEKVRAILKQSETLRAAPWKSSRNVGSVQHRDLKAQFSAHRNTIYYQQITRICSVFSSSN